MKILVDPRFRGRMVCGSCCLPLVDHRRPLEIMYVRMYRHNCPLFGFYRSCTTTRRCAQRLDSACDTSQTLHRSSAILYLSRYVYRIYLVLLTNDLSCQFYLPAVPNWGRCQPLIRYTCDVIRGSPPHALWVRSDCLTGCRRSADSAVRRRWSVI